jgi:hypothetical protein
LELFAEQSKANRVVAAVVGEGVERVKRIGDRVQLYEVKPDETGKTLICELPWRGTKSEV